MDNFIYEVKNIEVANSVIDSNNIEKKNVVLRYVLFIKNIESDNDYALRIPIRLNVFDLSGSFKNSDELKNDDLVRWALNSMSDKKKNGIVYKMNKIKNHKKDEEVIRPLFVGDSKKIEIS